MSTETTYEVNCPDAQSMESCGQRVGEQLRGGEIIELVGDVGSGKTTFVRGLARGLGSSDHVSSPTFTISNTYQGRLVLHHLDLYRLAEPGLLRHQVSELLQEPNLALVIEWGSTVAAVLPEQRVIVRFRIGQGETRKLQISIPKEWGYITC